MRKKERKKAKWKDSEGEAGIRKAEALAEGCGCVISDSARIGCLAL